MSKIVQFYIFIVSAPFRLCFICIRQVCIIVFVHFIYELSKTDISLLLNKHQSRHCAHIKTHQKPPHGTNHWILKTFVIVTVIHHQKTTPVRKQTKHHVHCQCVCGCVRADVCVCLCLCLCAPLAQQTFVESSVTHGQTKVKCRKQVNTKTFLWPVFLCPRWVQMWKSFKASQQGDRVFNR